LEGVRKGSWARGARSSRDLGSSGTERLQEAAEALVEILPRIFGILGGS